MSEFSAVAEATGPQPPGVSISPVLALLRAAEPLILSSNFAAAVVGMKMREGGVGVVFSSLPSLFMQSSGVSFAAELFSTADSAAPGAEMIDVARVEIGAGDCAFGYGGHISHRKSTANNS